MASVEKLPMLAEGYERLTAELKALREERPKIVEAIEEARAHGDLSENAEYHAAKERQGQVEATIADLEDRVSRAQIIDPTSLSGDRIVFGATVTLRDDDEKPVRYQIVGPTEADAKVGRISYNSPLGRALIGRKVEEEIEVTVPSGDRFYVVEKIEFICAAHWRRRFRIVVAVAVALAARLLLGVRRSAGSPWSRRPLPEGRAAAAGADER
jgi:transcription elongation factor GreA